MIPKAPRVAIAVALALLLCACGDSAPAPEATPESPPPAQQDDANASAATVAPVKPAQVAWQPAALAVPEQARDALLIEAVEAEKAGRLFGAEPMGALDIYLALEALQPPVPEAQVGRERVIAALEVQFSERRTGGRLDEAAAAAAVLRVVAPAADKERTEALETAERALAEVALGQRRESAGQWLGPRGASAVSAYRAALALVPGFAPAKEGLSRIENQLIERALAAGERNEFRDAEADLRRAARVGSDPRQVQDAAANLAKKRSTSAESALAEANEAMDRLDLGRAAALIDAAKEADAQVQSFDRTVERLAMARRYGHFRPGQRFTEPLRGGGDGPALVVIPYGEFRMGAAADEANARENESPSHEVRFERGFALAARETTVAEFSRFVAATGYRTVAEREGRSSAYDERGGAMVAVRGAHWRRSYLGKLVASPDAPVVHVAFADAQAYAEWLSAQTGQRYRLPSEAEFEYTLRAGESAPWAWGERLPRQALANLTGEGDKSPLGRRWGRAIRGWGDGHWGPAPVGSYAVERFGTFDMMGNVSEWVEDCWHDSYRRAPSDGRAWVNPGCRERVVRGGSWASTEEQARSAFRLQVPAELTSARIGFRVARDL